MKTLNLFSKGEQTIRYLVLCDAPERKEADVASKSELETLVRETVREELEKKGVSLNQTSVERAIQTANAKLMVACKGDEKFAGVSLLVLAENAQEGKAYPVYLVGGVGESRVYGIGQDKVSCLFSIPEKKSTRLGLSEKAHVQFTRISGKTYPTLVALPQKAYSKVQEKNWETLVDAPNLPEKARELFGKETPKDLEGWIVIPGPVISERASKPMPIAKFAVMGLALAAILGTSFWIRHRRNRMDDYNEPIAIEKQEAIEIPDEITTMVAAAEENLIAVLGHQELLFEPSVVRQDAFPAPLTEEFSLIGTQFEEEIAAYQTLVDEYQAEVLTLREKLGEQTELLAEDTFRIERMKCALKTSCSTVATLENKLETTRKQLTQKELDLNAFQNMREQVTQDNAEKEQKVAHLQQEREELVERLSRLVDERLSLETSRENLLAEVVQLGRYKDAYEKEHQLRIERDEAIASMTINMKQWKNTIQNVSQSRQQRANQLRSARRSAVQRIHLVSAGETIEEIAHKYYADFNMVDVILEANQDVVRDAQNLPMGTALRIP